jgi:hypothetical protein
MPWFPNYDPWNPSVRSHVQHYRSVVAFAGVFSVGCVALAYRYYVGHAGYDGHRQRGRDERAQS